MMKEIPWSRLLTTVTLRRLMNAGQALAAFLLSALWRRPIVWGRPFILTVEPTNLCNLKCPLCVTGNGRMTRRSGIMDLEQFRRIIDVNGDKLFYLLLYQQGEPYINSEFVEFIRYAKRKRIFVTTSTNAHYLSPEVARETVASKLDSIIISIDGGTQGSYAKYRVGGRLDTVEEGVRNLVHEKKKQRSRSPHILIQFIVMKHNEHEIRKMKRLTRDLGADKLLVKKVQVENMREAKKWLPQNTAYRRYDLDEDSIKPKHRGRGLCPRPWTSSLINWDGSISPCCFDKNGQHRMDTLNEHDLKEVWYSGAYAQFRSKMLRDRSSISICTNCSQGLRLYL